MAMKHKVTFGLAVSLTLIILWIYPLADADHNVPFVFGIDGVARAQILEADGKLPLHSTPNQRKTGAQVGYYAKAYGLPPPLEWDRTFGGPLGDGGQSVQQTSDGGYIIAGWTQSYGAGNGNDVWLIKTDSSGNKLWDKTFGGSGSHEGGNSVQQTSDGGYIIAGFWDGYGHGEDDLCLMKTDSNGNGLWGKTFGKFGTGATDCGWSAQQTSDGGYIVCGYTCSYGAGSDDVWLIKTDSNGNMLWDKTFGGTSADPGYSVQQTSDGGYVITGWTASYGAGSADVWLIKTDSNGTRLWDKTFGGTLWDGGHSVQQTSDGSYIIAGTTESYGAGDYDVWLIKTDSNGNKLWDKTFGGANYDDGFSVQQTSDGGYIITGGTESYGAGDCDVWVIKTDSNGDKLWDKTLGGTARDFGYSVQQTSDGGYVLTGLTQSYGAGGNDVWLIKIAAEQPLDNTPPTAVTGLSVKEVTANSVTLTWTAPGDDGNIDTASQYDIRYSTSPITEANWASATQCTGMPSPQPGGSSENFIVPNLNPGTTYYFALKTADEVPNWSGLSNVVQVTTEPTDTAPPNCNINLYDTNTGLPIDEIGIGGIFHIYVGDSTDDIGIKHVRFSSDDFQNGVPQGTWTQWYDWDNSSNDWDSIAKVKTWSFESGGNKEVWVEVEDGAGNLNLANKNIRVYVPILLVHGFQSGQIFPVPTGHWDLDSIWYKMILEMTGKHIDNGSEYERVYENSNDDEDYSMKRLQGNGYVIYVSNYNHDQASGTHNTIETYAIELSNEIWTIKQRDKVSKVDIVAHSMGGLISRTYIENEGLVPMQYRGDVRKLIMLGTPNHGVLREFFTSLGLTPTDVSTYFCIAEMLRDSLFLNNLNADNDGTDTNGVEYSAIAGSVDLLGTDAAHIVNGVPIESVYLPEIPPTPFRWNIIHCSHTLLTKTMASIELVKALLYDGQMALAPDIFSATFASPGELRVKDSQSRTTGVINGQITEDIPNSFYDSEYKSVAISPIGDSYITQVVGTDNGPYGLYLDYTKDGNYSGFSTKNIPIESGAVHQYAIDWDALAQGQEGVTIQVDSNSDGTFERTVTTDSELTTDEFWPYTFEDSKRGTKLRINDYDQTFQFIAPNKEFPISKAKMMKIIDFSKEKKPPVKYNSFHKKWELDDKKLDLDELKPYVKNHRFNQRPDKIIIIKHKDSNLQLSGVIVDGKENSCVAIAKDLKTKRVYILVDEPGLKNTVKKKH